MAEGLPQQTRLGQLYRTPLSTKVFSSWDFCIRVQEAATVKKHEISHELKVCVAQCECVVGKVDARGCVSVHMCAGCANIDIFR